MEERTKREMVTTLQANLMKLAQVIFEKKSNYALLSSHEKEVFIFFNNEFREIIEKLPKDFYFDEIYYSCILDILNLSKNIERKIESLTEANKN